MLGRPVYAVEIMQCINYGIIYTREGAGIIQLNIILHNENIVVVGTPKLKANLVPFTERLNGC